MDRIYRIPDGQTAPSSQIGATLEALAKTISSRREAGEESYTFRLLTGNPDKVLKKVMEEAGEVALAAKDADNARREYAAVASARQVPRELRDKRQTASEQARDHLRYEAADVVYHLLVVLERYGIGIDEFAAELNTRMTDGERPAGGAIIVEEHVNRG